MYEVDTSTLDLQAESFVQITRQLARKPGEGKYKQRAGEHLDDFEISLLLGEMEQSMQMETHKIFDTYVFHIVGHRVLGLASREDTRGEWFEWEAAAFCGFNPRYRSFTSADAQGVLPFVVFDTAEIKDSSLNIGLAGEFVDHVALPLATPYIAKNLGELSARFSF